MGESSEPEVTTASNSQDPSLIIRGLWYIFVGWWATGIWLAIAWVLNLTIIGLPIGIKMINKVPKVLTLKNPTSKLTVDADGNVIQKEQYSLVVRGVYFLLIGWWASGIWMGIAYLLSLTIIGLPIAVMMYNKLPFVVSLYKY